MTPRASDDAVPEPVVARTTTPQPRRLPAGTPLATPIVELPPVADATAPVARVARPRFGRWIAATSLLVVALAAAYALYLRAARREAFEAAYPVVATDAAALDRDLARWSTGERRLAATLPRFQPPALDTLIGAGACTLSPEGAPRFAAGPDLATDVHAWMDDTIEAGRRGRFASEAARDELMARLAGPVLVTAGTLIYAFDPGTGELACAGTGSLRAVEERD